MSPVVTERVIVTRRMFTGSLVDRVAGSRPTVAAGGEIDEYDIVGSSAEPVLPGMQARRNGIGWSCKCGTIPQMRLFRCSCR